MNKNYLTLFWLSLIGALVFLSIAILLIIFSKKIVMFKKYGLIILFFVALITFGILANCFLLCLKDYKYYSTGTYVEITGTVVEFMYVKRDNDGNGKVMYRKPKFLIEETGEYIVLNVKDVNIGETYTVKYYPNTKICGAVERIEEFPQ